MIETVNADPAELAKFSELAHRWWDPDSEFRPLHQINPLRLDWIHGLSALTGKRVLDVGCGGGILADSMARKGADVLGIDLATKALRVAQLHALEAIGRKIAIGEHTDHAQPDMIEFDRLPHRITGREQITCGLMTEHGNTGKRGFVLLRQRPTLRNLQRRKIEIARRHAAGLR